MVAEAEALLDVHDRERVLKLQATEGTRVLQQAHLKRKCDQANREKEEAAKKAKLDRIRSKREDLASAEEQVKAYCRTGKVLPTLRVDARRMAARRRGNADRMFRAMRERDAFLGEAESMSIYGNNCLITSILLPPFLGEAKLQSSSSDQPEVLEAILKRAMASTDEEAEASKKRLDRHFREQRMQTAASHRRVDATHAWAKATASPELSGAEEPAAGGGGTPGSARSRRRASLPPLFEDEAEGALAENLKELELPGPSLLLLLPCAATVEEEEKDEKATLCPYMVITAL